jgi:hypothetical protein
MPPHSPHEVDAGDILHLEFDPLDLDLLRLVVHLDEVVLDITAQPGAGHLLGNLLCAIANLLNGNGGLTAIVSGLASCRSQPPARCQGRRAMCTGGHRGGRSGDFAGW